MIVETRARDGAALRLLARPVRRCHCVLVVGEPLAQRERALASLHALLAVGGPLALLIASVIGYALAAAALRPVERMRRHAAAVTAAGTSGQLPVPPANDEIGRLGRTLNEMLARLEVSFKRERAFVSDASHELRTPLAILRTELELALRGKHTKQELEDALRSAAEESERLSQPRRGPAGDRALGPGPAAGAPGAARRGRGARAGRGPLPDPRAGRGAPAGGRSLAGGASCNADPARVEQALANLVDNALTYGDGAVRAERAARERQRRAARQRRGRGLPARVPAARVRALHPRRRGAHARRQRARARDRRRGGGCARRQRARAEPPGRRGRVDRPPS